MSDEKTATEFLIGLGALILAGLTGHNYLQIGKLREDKAEIPKGYRAKGDCENICEGFRASVDKMAEQMERGFNRVYDKLDAKEDKHKG